MSLIEVLVAFTILAMTMSVILRINSGAVRNHQIATHYIEAVEVARTRLEQLSAEIGAENYTDEGVEQNTYTWRYQRQPYSWGEPKFRAVPLTAVEEVITVSWDAPGGERIVNFNRIRVIRAKL
jgi:general secretion pathway protein I